MDAQSNLIKKLVEKLGEKKVNVFLQKHLGISRSSAYKKINGQIGISIIELEKILSITEIFPNEIFHMQSSHLTFASDALRKAPDHPYDYLDNFLKHAAKIQNIPDVRITYISNEVPLFHLTQFPLLLKLKLYLWNLSNWGIPEYMNQPFSQNIFPNTSKFLNVLDGLKDIYISYDATEVWTVRGFDSILEQIKFLVTSMMIKDRSLIEKLLHQVDRLFRYLKVCAGTGIKRLLDKNTTGSEVKVYSNAMLDNVNMIFVTSPQVSTVFHMLDTPNYIYTTDDRLVSSISGWVDTLLDLSHLLTNQDRGHREQFFTAIEKRINKGKKEINGLCDYLLD